MDCGNISLEGGNEVVYKHGGNIYEIGRECSKEIKDIIDFSANINPLGMSEMARKAIIENLDSITHYPDYTYSKLKDTIVDYHSNENKISEENIFLSNGAADGIYSLVQYLKPTNAIIFAPGFGEYEMALEKVNSRVKYYYLKEKNDFQIDIDEYIENIDNTIDMIILCNPNNPTGKLIEKEYLLRILDYCREHKINVLLDEAFCDFLINEGKFSLIDKMESYKNLYILRSLTKFFSIPGLRLGYILSENTNTISDLNLQSPPWRINSLAEISGIASMEDNDFIESSKEYMNCEKLFLYNELRKIKCVKVFEPSVNYIFFKLNKGFCSMGVDLKDSMLKRNILIRSCDNYVGLDGDYFRVAVRTRGENQILIDSLVEIFGGL